MKNSNKFHTYIRKYKSIFIRFYFIYKFIYKIRKKFKFNKNKEDDKHEDNAAKDSYEPKRRHVKFLVENTKILVINVYP